YTALIDVAEGYYLDGQLQAAQELSAKISAEIVERLGLYSQVNPESQKQLGARILRELNEFNYLVQIIKAYDSSEFGTELQTQFEENKALFSALFSEAEE
ncbi:MAG: hypothetical protein ACPHDX_07725, partial [Flavobacteriaceae bacterium]